jgi:hypothetical protein
MALCTDYSLFVINSQGSAQFTDFRAFYYSYNNKTVVNNTIEYSRYTRFPDFPEYPSIEVVNLSGTDYVWALKSDASTIAFRTRTLYSASNVPNCPHNLQWVYGPQDPYGYGGLASFMTVKGYTIRDLNKGYLIGQNL